MHCYLGTSASDATRSGPPVGKSHGCSNHVLAALERTHIPSLIYINTMEKIMNEKTDTNDSTDTPAEVEPMRILKIGACPSLSGRSELTYHVGCDKTKAIHFRVWTNTAAGMFSTTWVTMAEVSKLLSKPEKFTSVALQPLFEATSRNNAGFTLALLQGEGLIEKSDADSRAYQTANPAQFLARINALVASDVDLHEDDEPSDAVPMSAAATPKRGRPKKQAA
jgi:hypothetical protein